MADRALGLAPAADPELAEPATGNALRRRRPRRLHDNARGHRVHSDYAATIDAPVRTQTTVTSVGVTDDGYQVATDRGVWNCGTVVLASGACNIANVPPLATAVPTAIRMLTPMSYRSPRSRRGCGPGPGEPRAPARVPARSPGRGRTRVDAPGRSPVVLPIAVRRRPGP